MHGLFTMFVPLSVNSVLFGAYDYLLPLMLYIAWSTLSFLDLAQTPQPQGRTMGWAAAILLLPFLGAAAYLLSAATAISRTTRLGVVIGGLVVTAAAVAYTMLRLKA